MDNPLKPLVEYNADLVDRYYPNLRMSNRWEWNHKVAYLCWLDTKMVGQKSTNPTSPISEDTIGILAAPLTNGVPGQNLYPQHFEAVDLVQGSTGNRQWLSFGTVNQNFLVPTIADISKIPDSPPGPNPEPPDNSVPWVAYDESLFNLRLQQQLAYDYGRRPQNADFQVTTWAARVFHSTYMGPEKKPLGFDEALKKHRPEWCGALGVIVDNTWF